MFRYQLIHGTFTAPVEPKEQRDKDQYRPQSVHPLGLCEAEFVHGSLRNQVPESSAAVNIKINAALTHNAWW